MGSVRIDPYYYKQPPLLFVDELRKPVHEMKPEWFVRTQPLANEVCVQGAFVVCDFQDEEGLLETALTDFSSFLNIYGIAGRDYPFYIRRGSTDCFEAYQIEVTAESCIIISNDTEGVRRALIFLEDEMHRRSGPILPLETINRKPVIKERITRGFFSPTNRPPKNIDELLDDIEYYPDEYLNRLAHDGTNGLWIYAYFNQLIPSDIFVEYGENYEKRIEKLKKVVAKCKCYGVKVWIFGVEPFAIAPELASKYPDAIGGRDWNGRYSVCTYSEQGANYCIEVTQRLFELVPDLGGIIDITYGERPTSCANLEDYCQCPRCRNYSRSQILAHTIDLLKEGIRRSGSKAEFVSWTYAHRLCSEDEIKEYVRLAPEDVVLQENFEDRGYVEQLGRERQALDYWLSYPGPSRMFSVAAETAVKYGKRMYAKMQVCCSHELATVPYIPVPGILFDKYAAANNYHVEGVMQCWYFGNYPSLMSKAAGELAFVDDFSDKELFLRRLAGIYCGSQADQAAQAWKLFEEGYKNCPINIMFSYYGPLHDGVVWDLQLEPKDASLPRSWQLLDKPDGDRIGECLQCGHTLAEAAQLTQLMSQCWKEGISVLPENLPQEMVSVAHALRVLLGSGSNVMKFYMLREQLALPTGRHEEILIEMGQIVEEEIIHSEQMIALCEKDTRLGYHSEAEGYKFFPEKLKDRISKLRSIMNTEFPRVLQRIKAGKCPLAWYEGKTGPGMQMTQGLDALALAGYEKIADQDARFRVAYDEDYLYIELKGAPGTKFRMHFEFKLMWPSPGVVFENGSKTLSAGVYSLLSLWGERMEEELSKYEIREWDPSAEKYLIAIDRTRVDWTEDRPIRLMIAANDKSWIYDDDPVHVLGKSEISPGEFGWLRS